MPSGFLVLPGFLGPGKGTVLDLNDIALPVDDAQLRAIGIEDPVRAAQLLRGLMAPSSAPISLARLPLLLLTALGRSPDPDRSLSLFARWLDAASNQSSSDFSPLLETLLQSEAALERFCLVTGCSQYFGDLLARNPAYIDLILEPGLPGERRTTARLYRDLSEQLAETNTVSEKRDTLRRWKAREMMRIGVRDLTGLADMPTTAREFSHLADACVQSALEIAALETGASPDAMPVPFAVIGLGKLGGQELNYSSDIDLLFVHGDILPPISTRVDGSEIETASWLDRFAETVVGVLSEGGVTGTAFRVDMRLRPEGRFGPLVLSLSSCRAYYERWAENWERQALIKARFVAGDHGLGDDFLAMITPFVYRRRVSNEFLNDIRANKRRIEQKCRRDGQTRTNIKTGTGGIRDVEFIVQLLQLEFGGARPYLRTANTLSALRRLNRADLLTDRVADALAEDYRFLRTLEHRLQLLHNFQTQKLPSSNEVRERGKVARRMGFDTVEAFEAELDRRRTRLHGHLEVLFYDPSQPIAGLGAPDPQAARFWEEALGDIDACKAWEPSPLLLERLELAGFRDLPFTLRTLQLLRRSKEFTEAPHLSREFMGIAPDLLDLSAHSPNPDLALAGIEELAVPDRDRIYTIFAANPDVMRRLVRLGAAPPLVKRLARHQEWLETLLGTDVEDPVEGSDDGAGDADPSAEDFDPEAMRSARHVEELALEVGRIKSFDAQLAAVARFYQRENLRIASRDTWGEADASTVMNKLSRLAEAILQIVLNVCADVVAREHTEPEFARDALRRMAIVGLGKLGGEELSYSSDWDIVFVYDDGRSNSESVRHDERFAMVSAVVERFLHAVEKLKMRGANIDVDIRLRPWGRQGALVYSHRGFLDYYRDKGETWERQAALKARFVAGNPHVGGRLVRILHAVSFGHGLSAEEDHAVRAMKKRIEDERLKAIEQTTDLKLGFGGLTDIEWLAQRLQLLHGRQRPKLRVSNTLRAISALTTERLLDKSEADVLEMTFLLLTRVRNAIWLITGSSGSIFPAEPVHRHMLARILGYADTALVPAEESLQEEVQALMQDTRRIFQRRFQEIP